MKETASVGHYEADTAVSTHIQFDILHIPTTHSVRRGCVIA